MRPSFVSQAAGERRRATREGGRARPPHGIDDGYPHPTVTFYLQRELGKCPCAWRSLRKGLGVDGCAPKHPVLPPSTCPGRASGALPVTWAAEGSSSPDLPPPSRAPGGWAWAAPARPPGPALLSSGHRALWRRLQSASGSSDLPIQTSSVSGLQAGPVGQGWASPGLAPGPLYPFLMVQAVSRLCWLSHP